LLASTGVAGNPESYFRRQDEPSWATRWGISDSDGTFEYALYLQSALAAGRSENGVFGARVMWGTLDEIVDKLGTVYPDLARRDIALLHRAFGQLKFIYLQRRDVVAQAVSWLRAEQTQVWVAQRDEPRGEPHFEFDRLREMRRIIDNHNAAWESWFTAVGAEPHRVTYEDLDRDPVGVTLRVLDFQGLELPSGCTVQLRHRRLRDRLNAEWVEQYIERETGGST
jgi:LPS sulfotransferase NodH